MLGTCYIVRKKKSNSKPASLVSRLLIFFQVISAKNPKLLGSLVTVNEKYVVGFFVWWVLLVGWFFVLVVFWLVGFF